jgi:hypothetical protein
VHLRKHHSVETPVPVIIDACSKINSVITKPDLIEVSESLCTNIYCDDVEMEDLDFDEDFSSISKKAFIIAIGFKARSRISQSVLNEFLATFDDFYEEIIDLILKIFVKTHKKVINSDEVRELSKKIAPLKRPFNFINSKYLQEKELKKTGI